VNHRLLFVVVHFALIPAPRPLAPLLLVTALRDLTNAAVGLVLDRVERSYAVLDPVQAPLGPLIPLLRNVLLHGLLHRKVLTRGEVLDHLLQSDIALLGGGLLWETQGLAPRRPQRLITCLPALSAVDSTLTKSGSVDGHPRGSPEVTRKQA